MNSVRIVRVLLVGAGNRGTGSTAQAVPVPAVSEAIQWLLF